MTSTADKTESTLLNYRSNNKINNDFNFFKNTGNSALNLFYKRPSENINVS
jgi:hypothetical protein